MGIYGAWTLWSDETFCSLDEQNEVHEVLSEEISKSDHDSRRWVSCLHTERSNNFTKFNGKSNFIVDNIVPHNRVLLVRFQCRSNVEVCYKTRSKKYLFKYVSKGPKRAKITLKNEKMLHRKQKHTTMKPIDETKCYLDCRYIFVQESCWRIYAFEIYHRKLVVERLCIHLPKQQIVYFHDYQSVCIILGCPHIEKMQFTEWLTTNIHFPSARTLTYAEFGFGMIIKKLGLIKTREMYEEINYVHPASG